jgi:hypothetical protein
MNQALGEPRGTIKDGVPYLAMMMLDERSQELPLRKGAMVLKKLQESSGALDMNIDRKDPEKLHIVCDTQEALETAVSFVESVSPSFGGRRYCGRKGRIYQRIVCHH